MKSLSNVLWGAVLIGLGLIFALNAMNVTDIHIFFNGWWTLFIIVPCFIDLFNEGNKTWSIIWLVIGMLLLLSAQNLIDLSIIWKLIFPIILMALGLSLIFKDRVEKKVTAKIKELNKKNNKEYCATFSEQKLDFANEEFNGCDLNAVFGGVKCDLRNAKIEKDIVINASSIFGGITIYVPKNVLVKVKATPIFGGVDNKHSKNNQEAKITVYVNATCLFGGVEIK